MTLRWHFLLKSGLMAGLIRFFCSLSDATVWTRMTIPSYFQWQKYSPMTWDCGDIRIVWIFAKVPAQGGVGWQCDGQKGNFLMPSVAMSWEPLEIESKLSFKLMTEIFSMDSSFCCVLFAWIIAGFFLERSCQTTGYVRLYDVSVAKG